MIILSILLSFGIIFSGTISRVKISNAFNFSKKWNPSYLISLIVAMIINIIMFNIFRRCLIKPLKNDYFEQNNILSAKCFIKILIGSFCIGFSFGLGNISPTSMFMNLQFLTPHLILVFFAFFLVGHVIGYYMWKGIQKCFEKSHDEKKGIYKKQLI